MNSQSILQNICIWAIPVLFAITVHEVMHGWVASKLGDTTALMMGRLTLNPLKHIDLVGTILVPLMFLVIGGFMFGWAKPVPVNWLNLKHPRRDMAIVALAGPFSNFLMALGWAGIAKLALSFVNAYPLLEFFVYMGQAGIAINLMLGILNLIPIPPLDGGRVLAGMLPPSLGYQLEKLEPFGFMILILLIFTGVLSSILTWPYTTASHFIVNVFGL